MNIKRIGFTALIAILSTLITIKALSYFGNSNHYTTFEQKQAAAVKFARLTNSTAYASGSISDFTYAASMTTPAVVHIKTIIQPRNTQQNRGNQFDPFGFGQQFFNFPDPYHNQPQEASGSGVIISDDGYIVTNNHVVDDGDKIQVVLFDKRAYDAKVIGTDPSTDLALLKIDEKGLPFVIFGNSDSVKVGQWALAVGNPFNLESTVTAGIISAKGRHLDLLSDKNAIEDYIQTDAAVNPGNSGGALVNTKGELVGINSAIASPNGVYAGYAFAVPVNIVSKVVNDLMKFGSVQRGYLGITMQPITSELAKDKGFNSYAGVYVDSVLTGSAANEAGLKRGDLITKINGMDVNSTSDLQGQVSKYHPGDKIAIVYIRSGKEANATATLKNREGGNEALLDKPASSSYALLGAQFSDISPKEMKQLGLTGGVKVMKLEDGKLARNTDIHEGFIITKIDNKPINNTADLKAALENKHGGVMIEGTYANAPGQYFYAFGL